MREERDKSFETDQADVELRVCDLRKVHPGVDGYPPKVAIKGISFRAHKNMCIGILGHNGAGKVGETWI